MGAVPFGLGEALDSIGFEGSGVQLAPLYPKLRLTDKILQELVGIL